MPVAIRGGVTSLFTEVISIIPRHIAAAFFVVGVCLSIGGCGGSRVELRRDSRLPRWFRLPPGVDRRDVTVTLSYEPLTDWGVDNVVMTLVDNRNREIAVVRGQMCGQGSRWVSEPPAYVAVTAGGITEVVEYRAGGGFRVSDDAGTVDRSTARLDACFQ